MAGIRLLTVAALATVCVQAHAANMGFLGNAPISRMTEEDVDMFYQAVQETLDKIPDKTRTGWENAATGASGTLLPLDSFAGPAGEPCRHLQITNRAGGLRSQHVFTLCKGADGSWKAVAEE
jgi:surface antigen